jgi:hypothetical protein
MGFSAFRLTARLSWIDVPGGQSTRLPFLIFAFLMGFEGYFKYGTK